MKAGAVARVLILWMLAPAATLAIGWYVVLPRMDLAAGKTDEKEQTEPAPRFVKPPKVTVGVKKTEAIEVRRPVYSGTRRRKKETTKTASTTPVVIKEAPPAPPVVSPPSDAPPSTGGGAGGGGETTPVGNGGL